MYNILLFFFLSVFFFCIFGTDAVCITHVAMDWSGADDSEKLPNVNLLTGQSLKVITRALRERRPPPREHIS